MARSLSLRRRMGLLGAMLGGFWMVAGCASIQPYEPRNHREEGPERGVFTGAAGELVIGKKAPEAPK